MYTLIPIVSLIVLYLLYEYFLNHISNFYDKKIKKTFSTKEAIRYRKIIKIASYCITIATIIVFLQLVFLKDDFHDLPINGWLLNLIPIIILDRILTHDKGIIERKISTFNKEKYIRRNPSFALYLRAFEKDLYSEPNYNYNSFYEYDFIKAIKKYIPVCAIGMTKEVFAPLGATRIYVSDTTWQSEVKELMNDASVVFVLINDRPSCIWEIEQSLSILQKTVFIIDSWSQYSSIRNKFLGRIAFPDEDEIPIRTPFCIHFNDSYNKSPNYKIYNFSYTLKSYKKLIRIIFSNTNIIDHKRIKLYIIRRKIITYAIYLYFAIMLFINIISIIQRHR